MLPLSEILTITYIWESEITKWNFMKFNVQNTWYELITTTNLHIFCIT